MALTFGAVRWVKKFTRYTDYLGAAQLYLKNNFFLEEELKPEDFKARILGHWGTVPGLNFIYANLNYLASKHKCSVLFVAGPGHGAPAVLANLYAEGTLKEFYKDYTLDKKGTGKIIKDFSWPHTPFPSHVTPTVPGSILEGGELGYSLSTAFGAALDNPDLIVAAVIGDGEAETGPIATAWHSNKFLNPKTSGAVLPIVHINGYKISNPTLFGTMSDEELYNLFNGYGYAPIIVKGRNIERKMLRATEHAYRRIRKIQRRARTGKKPLLKPRWPVILLRSPKGWKGVHRYHGHKVEGSFHSHGIPIGHPNKDKDALPTIKKWLKSYKIHRLLDNKGRLKPSIRKFIPKGRFRLGMNPHAIGGDLYKPLKIPRLSKYETKIKSHDKPPRRSSMIEGSKLLRDLFKKNPRNFRLLCPDELESNKLTEVFKATSRAYLWPTKKTDENISPDGRVMEMLSEHTLQGWLQGYLLTGRHGLLVSYEAFAPIMSSMVDQYAKFLKQALRVPWRKPVASANYLLSSVGWRQDHNGFSHQNPSFVSNVLQKHEKFCQIYYPSDANSLIATYEEVFRKKDSICVIVAGKRDLPQYQTLAQARKQAKTGIAIWDWVTSVSDAKKPDVVLVSAGDYITQEAIEAIKLCKQLAPSLKIRYVNVSELTALSLGDSTASHRSNEAKTAKFLTKDKPVVFSYHGYTNDIEQILWPYTSSDRFTLHGYTEEGSTTTPFDMKVANQVSRYHLAIDLITQAAKRNRHIAGKKPQLIRKLKSQVRSHQAYIRKHGDDPKTIEL